MKIDYNKINKNKYLKEAVSLRLCPDEQTIRDPYFKEKVLNHFKTCPLCKNKTPDPFFDLAESFKSEIEIYQPKPGEIASLKSELGKWKNNFYLVPPLVYLDKIKDDFFECFLVSPITEIFSEKDLFIPDLISDFIPFIIEGWNKIKIHKTLISNFICDLSDFKTDIDLFFNSETPPIWSKSRFKNKNMEEVKVFRKIEKFCASQFTSSPAFILAKALKTKAKKLISNEIYLKDNLINNPELLLKELATYFNPTIVHAGSEKINFYFYSVIVENEEIKNILLQNANLEDNFIENENLIITGTAEPDNKDFVYSGSHALFQTNSGKTIESIFSDFDEETNVFEARFQFSKGKNIWFFNWYRTDTN
ncbi:MAG: hypothetical protein RBR53_06045 [Desulforegulaceae bacterium]|nr:hypothetical protein [Desulforegulaceae bacterium]